MRRDEEEFTLPVRGTSAGRERGGREVKSLAGEMVNAIKGILITWLVSLPLLVFQLSLMLPLSL